MSNNNFFDEWESKRPRIINYIDNVLLANGILGTRATYAIMRPWLIASDLWREVKYAYQRVFVGYDERVTWSIDYYLAKMIPVWVRELKTKKHGVPLSVLDNLSDEQEISDAELDAGREKFNDVLEQIAVGFDSYREILDGSSWVNIKRDEYLELKQKVDIGFELFREHFGSLWD